MASTFARMEQSDPPFDVLHDHCGFTAFAFADRIVACGTPVIAFAEGSAPELVLDGETGFVVEDEHAMAAAVARLGEIDPARCRSSAEERFDAAPVAEAYEQAYELVTSRARSPIR